MNRRGNLHSRRNTWARARLEHDGRKIKLLKIEFLEKETGLMISAEGFRYGNMTVVSRKNENEKELRMYTTSWIE